MPGKTSEVRCDSWFKWFQNSGSKSPCELGVKRCKVHGGIMPIQKPEIVPPTDAQRARWTKTTRVYVEYLEGFISEVKVEISHLEETMRILKRDKVT